MQKDQKLNLEEAVVTLKRAGVPEDEMAALERQLAPSSASLPSSDVGRKMNFVSAGTIESKPDGAKKVANSEDIELPEDSDSDEDKVDIAQKEVPAAVFGELASKATEEQTKDGNAEEKGNGHLGALERIKRLRRQ